MRHRHVLLLAVAMAAAGSTPSWAVTNNGGGSPRSPCKNGLISCGGWCYDHNKYDKSLAKCLKQCIRYWCSGGDPSIVRNPVWSNGNPVEAPPPTRSRNPINAPIVKGRPIQAAPTNPPAGQPILERNSGGGHRH